MPTRTILIAGATGLVGHAAMQHFASLPDTSVIALSRRKPTETFGARFISVDLQDRAKSAEIFSAMPEVTHVVYAALYEKPGLVAGFS